MKRILAAAALLTIIATQDSYAQNFNAINGNGNRVVNGGGQLLTRNHSQIIGNGNTLINGSGGFRYPAGHVSVGHSCTAGHSGYPQYHHQPSGYRYQTAVPATGYRQSYSYHRQPVQPRLRSPRATNPLGIPINVNYNSVRGNANTVVNGGSTRAGDVAVDILGQIASGSAQRNGLNVNINRVRGNQNTIVNP